MSEDPLSIPSRDEARATLAAIDALRAEIRRSIAESQVGPSMIWCGLLWFAVFGYAQFRPGGNYWMWAFLAVFFVGQMVALKFRPRPIKPAPNWRMGGFWLAMMVYAGLFLVLLDPGALFKNLSPIEAESEARKIAAYLPIMSMFGYVLMGLWVSRFFVGLGLVVTVLILAGYYFLPEWLCLWSGVVGGGTFIISGVFIRKFWK